ncbi:hypothetical protein [Clostridium sp. VAP51]|uniref:hypothetical protein n=1 Tax=Clostridium sp. VAP51 TaxID=2949978 RepID=UPI00207A0127|nr:hypothetical protein [Clostridium sp. VAP51]
MELQFRTLKANEIDVRIAMVKQNGLSLLLYKDARCDMNILDETVGPFGWQRQHQIINDRLYCTVSIHDKETDVWVSKQDVGTESFTEKEKGQASDSFKRACFNWGIGRELYTSPFVWVTNANIYSTTVNGKTIYKCNDKFAVEGIKYDENKNIVELIIKNLTINNQAFPLKHGSDIKPTKELQNTKNYKCASCGNEVIEKVAKFSYSKHKKILCMDCQKKSK